MGVFNGACPRLIPGMFTDCKKYWTVGILSKVNRNFVGCSKLVFSGVRVRAVIWLFILQKKGLPKKPFLKCHS
jgi:hypothetical protein